jgi:hypothetical protein
MYHTTCPDNSVWCHCISRNEDSKESSCSYLNSMVLTLFYTLV